MSQTALAERQDTAPTTERAARALKPATTPSAMLAQAVASGAPFEVVQGLMAMLKETRAEEQKMAFDAALSAAKAEIPVILKNKTVGYEHKSGAGETSYHHEDLGQIARTIDPILSKHGLSYRFRTSSAPSEPVSVTCIVAHRDGYAEENTLTAGRDDSGKKNSIQAIGSTITYLQRYTLKAALGLAAAHDDDARTSEQKADLTEEQVEELKGLIDRAVEAKPGTSHAAWLETFLDFMKADSLNAIQPKDFNKAKTAIENAIRGGGRK